MNSLERYCIYLRHHPALENNPLWGIVRPVYNTLLDVVASKGGLERTINGTDSVRLHPRWRGIQENYEPLVWKHMTSNVRAGDVIVDVGAFVGLYTVALAKRVGPQGSVTAFEPDPTNFYWLQRHIILNHVESWVKLSRAALGERVGETSFVAGRDSQSHVGENPDSRFKVPIATIDVEFQSQRIDLLKIDTEGFEEKVLRGGMRLLKDASRRPRLIYVEIHPYAWEETATTSDSLLSLLRECDYEVSRSDGKPVRLLESYGEIVAHKKLHRQ